MVSEAAMAQVTDRVRLNVPGGIKTWLERYLDDPDVPDDDLLDMDRWDISGASRHVLSMLEDKVHADTLGIANSLEDALELQGPGGEWFYGQLIEFFFENGADRRTMRTNHVKNGGSVALCEGAL